MGEHATVEQDVFTTGDSEKREPVEIGECCQLELDTCLSVRSEPRKNSPLRACEWNIDYRPEEVSMTNENFQLTASRHFDLQSVIFPTLEKGTIESHVRFTQELNEGSVEESIKVGFLVSESKVRMVARDTIKMNLSYSCYRSDEVFSEKTSAIIDLFETC